MEQNNYQHVPPFARSLSSDPVYNNGQGRTFPVNLPVQNSRSLNGEGVDQAGFQRRTVESARQLRDNLNNVIRGIRPFVDTARIVNARTMAISSFLNRPQADDESTSHVDDENTVIINLDEVDAHNNVVDNVQDVPNNQEHLNNNLRPEEVTGNDRSILEAQRSLRPLQKYVPFILILLVKGLYDHHEGILNFAVLFVTFAYTDSTTKKEATKRCKKSISKLLLSLLYISLCIFFINYIFEEEKLYTSLIFIKTFDKPLKVWDLLWFVGITDFILKLITVALKIVVILTPGRLIPYQKRVHCLNLNYQSKNSNLCKL